MSDYLTRFAPSPTGRLHLGHAASAFHVWQAADRAGGQVLLRIEDIDQTRCRPEYTDGIFEDLSWLGFTWPGTPRIQSEHFADYKKVVERLTELGLTYRCFRTRREMAEETEAAGLPADTPFTGRPLPAELEAERLAGEAPFAWRLSLEKCRDYLGPAYHRMSYETLGLDGARSVEKARPELHGDINLTRKDAPTAYHVACTHDDALQGITHVIRGTDLEDAAHIHVLLQALMGWPTPVYTHHPLIKGPDGKKLAKRFASKSLASLREDGLTPEDVKRLAGV
ncbi:MAG: tRNA glutamyl-Q(34) synthetase GluQRS [Henriciella sp.]|uniref:tRNA glutamyl-Q(34) synthetase GluQRS n=1 Tax=Henriciella sp. TaxID=1968823 RepID=UPI000C113E5D|nr:tRNA glutamyl-Q(34) synthetase GluQRS [Henriciella sp.]MAN75037.1 tRNA glutamyl-Q(34) synthetase GluQRS [Henriciella sp.]MBF33766.1 tRNA glutamyl-Q(34) synthetase GluQRS [Hyphomonadaceae bacterium]MBK76831.1 tRNA glutamyl-Q(34) synthetase GluQRS [Henriciella sp.]PHR76441.1 MAG: tRNA glutamyl-Q(34) synthetase GluQRS [Henriciella sp.]